MNKSANPAKLILQRRAFLHHPLFSTINTYYDTTIIVQLLLFLITSLNNSRTDYVLIVVPIRQQKNRSERIRNWAYHSEHKNEKVRQLALFTIANFTTWHVRLYYCTLHY